MYSGQQHVQSLCDEEEHSTASVAGAQSVGERQRPALQGLIGPAKSSREKMEGCKWGWWSGGAGAVT